MLLAQDYLGVADYTLVAWTLCIELKFYLIIALFAQSIRRGNVSTVFAITFAALAANVAWTSTLLEPWIADWPQIEQTGLESACIVYMLIGVLFNFHLRCLISDLQLGIYIIVLSSVYLICSYIGPLTVEFPLTPACYGYALTAFSLLYGLRRFVRPFRPLDALASVSFPLYVIHSLIGYSTLKFLVLYYGLGYRFSLVLTIAIALAVATLLHRTVERWSIDVGKRMGKRRSVAAPTPGSTVDAGARPAMVRS